MASLKYVEDVGLTQPGEYVAEVDSATASGYRINGQWAVIAISWVFRVGEGEHTGQLIKADTPIDGKALFLLHRTLTALGLQPRGEWSFAYDDADGRMVDPDVLGRKVRVSIVDRAGRTRVNVMPASMGGSLQ